MTLEELEIIVTAKVEEALKEFQKILPTIKQTMKQAQEAFSKVDTKTMTSKLHQAVQFMKKKMQDFKKSSENNEIAIKVNNKDAQKQISQIQKQIDSLQEKINARQMKLNVITPRLDEITTNITKQVTPEGVSPDNPAIQKTINNSLTSNKEYNTLLAQESKITQEIAMYNKQLNEAKSKMAELGQQTSQTATTQNKLSSFSGAFKQKIEQVKPTISKIGGAFSSIGKSFSNVGNKIVKIFDGIKRKTNGIGNGFKGGLKHVMKYAMALFSLRGIYSVLSNCASSWLSSQNAGAKQLSANIDYMKYAMGSAFAPVIQWVTGLIYNLMKAIQSVVYALFRVNIFAKASASSYASMAGSAKKTKEETKQLAGVHDEINNVQDNGNSESGSNGGSVAPSFDLSQVDNQMSAFAQKLYDFFKPLKDSWDKYGPELVAQIKTTASQVGYLISSVWSSFEKIITNGTVYSILENILAIIGNISEAFANAWNYNGNGDIIVQNIANAFNNLLIAINNVAQSEGFQNWLNNCSDKFKGISEKLASIDWQPLIDALSNIGQNIGTLALDILSGLVDIFKWLAENPIVSEIILGIAIAIGILSTAYSIWATVTGVLTAVSGALNIALLPLVGIIAGIIAVIALIVVAIMNWGAISEWFGNLWQNISNSISNIWNNILNTAKNIFNGIKDTISNVFNAVKNTISNIWNGIINTISNVWNTIVLKVSQGVQGAWNAITSVFGNVANWFRDKFSQAWQAVKNVFSTGGKIFDGIKDGILNGLKSIVNAIIGGINKVISIPFNGINSALKAIKSVNIMGLQPFSWIKTISVPQIPRLAKGGIIDSPTIAMMGEYVGAKSNPEIVTPQNIMRETMEDVFSDYLGNNDQPISLNLTVKVSDKKLGQILLEDLRDKTRRTGKDIEALVGG